MPTISIVIPAHNEESVIARCLAFVPDAQDGEIEVIVVCNGCRDDTAAVAASLGSRVRVIETDVASKTHALNLGDETATVFPRLYLDADVVMDLASIRALATALAQPGALAAAPRAETLFDDNCEWAVRAFYRFWTALPFVQEGMITAGAYALSEQARNRFGRFPDIIADDGFVRLHFTAPERVEVAGAASHVRAPATLADLIKIRSRSRLGMYQLRQRFPDMFDTERRSKGYGHALARVSKDPSLYLPAIPFVAVSVLSRLRAGRQIRTLDRYVWERDDSSRE